MFPSCASGFGFREHSWVKTSKQANKQINKNKISTIFRRENIKKTKRVKCVTQVDDDNENCTFDVIK